MSVDPSFFTLSGFAFPVVEGSLTPVIPDAEDYSPADLLRWYMVSIGLGTAPDDNGTWPIYYDQEPGRVAEKDNVITCYDTAPRQDGRHMATGETINHYGVQIRVRGGTARLAYLKAKNIEITLNESTYNEVITLNSIQYIIYAVTNLSLLRLGKDAPNSNRRLYTLNGFISLRKLT